MRAAQFLRLMRTCFVKTSSPAKRFLTLVIGAAALGIVTLHAADPAAGPLSATELADRMNALREGNALIRTKLEVQAAGGARRVLQLQLKERRTKAATDIVYQVLWPNEHKGEAVILHQAGGAPKGSIIKPSQPVREIKPSQMGDGLFDSDLSYQDAVENFFAWKKQAIVGSEAINNVNCQILESKPDGSSFTITRKCEAGSILSVSCRCGSRNIHPPVS